MEGKKLRKLFLEYFEKNNHKIVKSSSLIPGNDKTLLFTNAGMNQFKEVFLGAEKRDYKRAASSQKCVRAGGKHNDLENVGKTARHHTFFEMLGNFSFGDYFKEEAIKYAWEFITEVLKIDKNKLYATVYKDDDEAYDIWHKVIGLDKDRIFRFGEKDNFWQMGDVGPCGPCSEIFYDHGEKYKCDNPNCNVGCECDRYVEIWNLVFMQFNKDENGKLTPLPKPSIDTGMGLERLAAVMQGVNNNYDTDLFQNIIKEIAKQAKVSYGSSEETDTALRVIADHMRATVFLISDGVVPSNEGRGYVLRRIMRRAIRYGKKIGLNSPSIYKFVSVVGAEMGEAYPELIENKDYIEKIIKIEEEQFSKTLDTGLKVLNDMLSKGKGKLDATDIFKLYDTFGFPIDLVEDVANEKNIEIDRKGFEKQLNEYRQKTKEKSGMKLTENLADKFSVLNNFQDTSFEGYLSFKTDSKVITLIKDFKVVDILNEGEEGYVMLDKTPFYLESGGQTGDTGIIEGNNFSARVKKVIEPIKNKRLHLVYVTKGQIKVNQVVTASLDLNRRKAIARNHTATHLLHAALKKVVGEHVNQAGSLVEEGRLRFDFTHYNKVTDKELKEIEILVNEKILENIEVTTDIKDMEEAKKEGATALFGEKYGDKVRVVTVGDFSKELCGGTHVFRTGDIGLFVIESEKSAASGIRRIEALTGTVAYSFLNSFRDEHLNLKGVLKTGSDNILEIVEKKLEEVKKLKQELEKAKMSSGGSEQKAIDLGAGISLLIKVVEDLKPNLMRELSDNLKQGKEKIVVFVVNTNADGCSYLLSKTKDLKEFHCGNALREIAPILEGRGGGKDTMAQGGGKWKGDIKTVENKIVEGIKKHIQ